MKFLIDRESKKTKKVNETPARMAEEILEARKEIISLKNEKNALVKEINSLKNDLFRKETKVREIDAEKAVLKHENQTNKLSVKAAETELKGVKKVFAICQVSNRNIKDENENWWRK